MLEAGSLRKAVIPQSLILNPSPGNLQSTRLALHVDGDGSSCSVYIASGCRVYKIQICMEKSMVTKGKESLLIPVPAQVIQSLMVDRCPHRSEIQSVVLAEGDGDNCLIMGTVDSYGHLIVSRLDVVGSDVDRLSYSVLPQDCGVGEGSWAGVCFSPMHWSTAYCANVSEDKLSMNVSMIALRERQTSVISTNHYQTSESSIFSQPIFRLWNPASLTFLQSSLPGEDSSNIIAVGEGSQLTMWDLRTNQNGGCIQRVCGSIGDIIYAVSSSPSGAIAVGGSDRTVTIYDPRRWSALSRWVNCSKYEITGLSFSSVDPAYMYVQGVDYEVICGQWKESQKAFSFRGDSNWLGFSKCADNDVLAGWCESGSIFVADIPRDLTNS